MRKPSASDSKPEDREYSNQSNKSPRARAHTADSEAGFDTKEKDANRLSRLK